MGHMSDEGIIKKKHGLFGGDVNGQVKLGEACVREMQSRVKFSLVQHSSMEILDYVHSGLWVPL